MRKGIANLIVPDAGGKKLFDSHDKPGKCIGAKAVMQALEKQL